VHGGALAFLVVLSPQSDKGETSADRPAYLHGGGRRSESGRADWFSVDLKEKAVSVDLLDSGCNLSTFGEKLSIPDKLRLRHHEQY